MRRFAEPEPHDDERSLRYMVYETIKEGILDGRYKAGDSLGENRIADELHVSRTPVREAIRQLEFEDLVVSIPNRGVFVMGLTRQDSEDIYTVRKLIEGQIVAWAIERITKEELNKLYEIVELMELYTKRQDTESLVRLDTNFHKTIYDACKSKHLNRMFTVLHSNMQLVREQSLKKPHRAEQSLVEHRKIVEAIDKKDKDEAIRLMLGHVETACKSVLEE
jgi:DNA-binding GntR family transcriptional regulator